MLRYLKERMMPEKTVAELSLETVEQGQRDRQARQQAAADAEAEAAHQQRLALYRDRQTVANLLVARYEHEAQAFDGTLRELSAIVERMSNLTLQIDQARAWLAPESRALQDTAAVVPYASIDVFVEMRRTLGQAWSRGQQT